MDELEIREIRLPRAGEESIHAEMLEFGREQGENYPRIWNDPLAVAQEMTAPVTAKMTELLWKPKSRASRLSVATYACFILGLIVFMLLFQGTFADASLFMFVVWMGISSLAIYLGYGVVTISWEAEQVAAERKIWLVDVGMHAAITTFLVRREDAKLHVPAKQDASTPFVPQDTMPLPQPYGVSHEGAEALCAQWMRFFGEADADVTRFTADGGIDVTSLHYIAQVKNYAGTVGVESIREMAGVALDDGRKALFFTSGNYAAGAIAFADRIGMPLFVYDAVEGVLTGANPSAESIFQTGL